MAWCKHATRFPACHLPLALLPRGLDRRQQGSRSLRVTTLSTSAGGNYVAPDYFNDTTAPRSSQLIIISGGGGYADLQKLLTESEERGREEGDTPKTAPPTDDDR